MTLRVGIDAWPLARQPTGIGRYVRELCLQLASRMPDVEFVLYSPRPIDFPATPGWTQRHDARGAGLPGLIWLKGLLPRLCARDSLDVFWAARTLAPRLPSRTAIVTTVYDLNHRVVPQTMQPLHRWAHRLWFARDVGRARAVVTISRGTADRLAAWLGRMADAIVPPAVSPLYRRPSADAVAEVLARHRIRPPYILSVGTHEPRKNLGTLIEAHARLHARGAVPHALVLAGPAGWAAPASGAAPVVPLGYVAESDLPGLYAGADLFVLPSLYEGFGIPVMEARACGARVLATDLPEMREAGGGDATYAPPTVGGLADGIVQALGRPRPTVAPSLPDWGAGAEIFERVLRSAAGAGVAMPAPR